MLIREQYIQYMVITDQQCIKIIEIKSNRLIILTIENDNYPIIVCLKSDHTSRHVHRILSFDKQLN